MAADQTLPATSAFRLGTHRVRVGGLVGSRIPLHSGHVCSIGAAAELGGGCVSGTHRALPPGAPIDKAGEPLLS